MATESNMDENSQRRLDGSWSYGRFYAPERPRRYLYPIDETALDGMDLFHKFFLEVKLGALFGSPLELGGTQPLRIIDLGTGTGIWAFDVSEVAEKTDSPVEITAVDMNMIQPSRIPSDVTVLRLDIEHPSWAPLQRDCNLIHMRQLNGSVRPIHWLAIYRNALQHLKPGGFIEHAEMDWATRWAGPAPKDSALEKWSQAFRRGMFTLGRNVDVDGLQVRTTLASAGFSGIRETTTRCFLSTHFSSPKIKVEKWFNAALRRNLHGMSLVPLIEGLGYTQEEVDKLCDQVKEEIVHCKTSVHFVLFTWTAYKPHAA
ncbi:hypothetical protein E4U35_003292 [Claviceps purpurea]|nr:hypothetical protein E4U35_003292 [Claviceps purpurea]KAG6276100.1 hypothetical protein E4U47_000278 [Claviceps purpurea]